MSWQASKQDMVSEQEKNMNELKCGDLTNEKTRVYHIVLFDGHFYDIRIENPLRVFYGPGHAFHRVFDGVATVLCPVPGFVKDPVSLEIVGYCEVSWEPKHLDDPCGW